MTNHPTQEPDYIDKMIKAHDLRDAQRHPTQGLQDMSLDLSTYSTEALAELQTRIEEEKTKRERKVPFSCCIEGNVKGYDRVQVYGSTHHILKNLHLRLSAEAKLRAAGGGSFKEDNSICLNHLFGRVMGVSDTSPTQGVIYFESEDKVVSAYNTLTPDEKYAIFGFGEG